MTRYGQRTLTAQPSLANWGQAAPVGIGYGVATGGTSSTITVSGQSYTMLTFTGAGTLTVTKAGLFDLLIIGGGSSGLSGWYGNGRPGGPGGGAGGALETTVYLSTNQTVSIGAGGAHTTGPFELFLGTASFVGANLGSGSASGRGSAPSWASGGNTAPVPQQKGFDGDNTIGASDGGGGGGQAAIGSGRNGGAGFDWSSWRGEVATTKYYGGGGGGQNSGGTNGTGGVGGGAAGTGNGTANTGGGGGGGDYGGAGGGGSGIVLCRFKI
jgi:hypothetical protein